METHNVVPKWIRFFDGEPYTQYKDFVKTRDISKMLYATRSTNKSNNEERNIDSSQTELHVSSDSPDSLYSEIPGGHGVPPIMIHPSAVEAKARKKRTRTYVLLGVLVMSLVAMLVALMLHFHMQKSLFGGPSKPQGHNMERYPQGFYANHTFLFPSAQPQRGSLKATKAKTKRVETSLDTLSLSHVQSIDHLVPMTADYSDTTLTSESIIINKTSTTLNFVCILKRAEDWESFSVIKLQDAEKDSVIATIIRGQKRKEILDPRVTAEYSKTGNDVELVVKITPPYCSDRGNYKCTVKLKQLHVVTSKFIVTSKNCKSN